MMLQHSPFKLLLRQVPFARVARMSIWCVSTFVLEVMGGAGALWGAAEVVGSSGHSLRRGWGDEHFGQPSFDLWRYLCAVTFALCLVRWALNALTIFRKTHVSLRDFIPRRKSVTMFSMRLPRHGRKDRKLLTVSRGSAKAEFTP